jgi:hypothetical protein
MVDFVDAVVVVVEDCIVEVADPLKARMTIKRSKSTQLFVFEFDFIHCL